MTNGARRPVRRVAATKAERQELIELAHSGAPYFSADHKQGAATARFTLEVRSRLTEDQQQRFDRLDTGKMMLAAAGLVRRGFVHLPGPFQRSDFPPRTTGWHEVEAY